MVIATGIGGIAFTAACSRNATFDDREVVVYSPRACPVGQSQAFSAVYGGGDFEPSQDDAPFAGLFLRDIGTVLDRLPSNTRALVLDISEDPGNRAWHGLADVPKSGPVNVLVWPKNEACALTRNVESRTGMTFGVFDGHVMIAGGLQDPRDQPVPQTYVGDLSTGILEALPTGLLTRRAYATVTEFRAGPDEEPARALVAGGEDPELGTAIATAEVYVPDANAPGQLGTFDHATSINLSIPRSHHGAVVLADGRTLLVGGTSGGQVVSSLEVVDPKEGTSTQEKLAELQVARKDPTVIRLASGEILVAGGTNADGRAEPLLEWFSPDAKTRVHAAPLVAGRQRAFVPLTAGGALAVIAPDTTAPDYDPNTFKTVWVISADYVPDAAIPIAPGELNAVRLFRGAQGAPVLWTGQAPDGSPGHWFRFDPWYGAFQPITDAPTKGPEMDAIASGDDGLALWLERRGDPETGTVGLYVTGYRFDLPMAYFPVRGPLLVTGPDGLAPDRLPGLPGSSIHFDPVSGLSLEPGASAFVTNALLLDFVAELDIVGATPDVVLRQEGGRHYEVGGVACAYTSGGTQKLIVQRKGSSITVQIDDRAPRACPPPDPTGLPDFIGIEPGAHVSLGLRGAAGVDVSGAKNLRVTRL